MYKDTVLEITQWAVRIILKLESRNGTIILKIMVSELERNCNSRGYSYRTGTGTLIPKVIVPELELVL